MNIETIKKIGGKIARFLIMAWKWASNVLDIGISLLYDPRFEKGKRKLSFKR